MKSSPTSRSWFWTGSRSCSMAAWPVRYVVEPGISPAAVRIAATCTFASAVWSFDTIEAVATWSEAARAPAKRPVGNCSAARSPAARTFGSSAWAWPGGVATTRVNDPSGFWPKWSLRMSAAFSLSEPGSAKRFVSRSERPADADPAATTATTQTASTAHRNRIIVRAHAATAPTRLVTTSLSVKRQRRYHPARAQRPHRQAARRDGRAFRRALAGAALHAAPQRFPSPDRLLPHRAPRRVPRRRRPGGRRPREGPALRRRGHAHHRRRAAAPAQLGAHLPADGDRLRPLHAPDRARSGDRRGSRQGDL